VPRKFLANEPSSLGSHSEEGEEGEEGEEDGELVDFDEEGIEGGIEMKGLGEQQSSESVLSFGSDSSSPSSPSSPKPSKGKNGKNGLAHQPTMSANGHKLNPQKSRRRSSGVLYAVYEPEHKPLFIYTVVIICTLVMLYEVYVNNQLKTDTDPCEIKIWQFCFEPISKNLFLGPSAETLLMLGAKTGNTVVVQGQYHRMFTCMFLHGGFFHLSFNMMALCQMGIGIEQSYGTVKVAMLFIMSGLFGSVTSTIFSPSSVGVGASGAIFGLFGAAWGDLIQNWDLYDEPGRTTFSLSIGTVVNLGIGTAPLLDNFAHFFGFCMGALLSLGLLVVERQTSHGHHKKLQCWHYVLEFFPVVLVPVLNCIALGILYSGVAGHAVCEWCTMINCIPFPWGCDRTVPGECVWDCNTCSEGGMYGEAFGFEENIYNATVKLQCPLLADWTSAEFEEVVIFEQDLSNNKFTSEYVIDLCKVHCPDAYLS
jgi:membrane associated rhomboid family serine protease